MARLFYAASLIPRILAVLLMATLLADMMLGVFFRYVVGKALPWSEEVGTLSLIWLTFVAGAIGVNRGAHFAIHLAVEQLGPRAQRASQVLVGLLILLLGLVLTTNGWLLMEANATSETPSLGISLSVQYASSFVGGLLMMGYSVALIVRVLRGQETLQHG